MGAGALLDANLANRLLARGRRFGSRNLFVVRRMAASLMLLLVTWFVATSFLNTARLDVGFETGDLTLISLDRVRDGYSTAETSALVAALPDELSRAAGVRAYR